MNPEIPYSKVKTFYHIVNEGSFSKCAKKLFITPGAVSQQMKDLEDKLVLMIATMEPFHDRTMEPFCDRGYGATA